MRISFSSVPKPGPSVDTPFPELPPNASVGKRWKFRRNAVIYVAYLGGFSQRTLADVFDLPRSRIGAIVRELSVYQQQEVERPTNLPDCPANASVSKRNQFRRNAVICAVYRKGFSQRTLADVFDLPRSTVGTICKGAFES